MESEAATASAQNEKKSKKRAAASDPDLETTRDVVDGECFTFKDNLMT